MSIEIRKVNDIPASRPARFCFGLQDDSVFADFDIDEEGRIFLLRISFDGYGCCGTANESIRMNPGESKRFVRLVEGDRVTSDDFIELLLHYFKKNEHVIWKDALEEHGLFPQVIK